MQKRNVTGGKFEAAVCRKNGWTREHKVVHGKLKLRDAINVKFNTKYLDKYDIPRKAFEVKYDALDANNVPIEIKKKSMVTKTGKKVDVTFSEYLSIKTYRDVYKLICEKHGYNYYHKVGNRKRITFDELYKKHKNIIPLDKLSEMTDGRKKLYYRSLMQYCQECGATEMFNQFVSSDKVLRIFNNWIKNYRKKDFFLYTKDDAYHSSQLSFTLGLVKAHWGLQRITVFVKLRKNV